MAWNMGRILSVSSDTWSESQSVESGEEPIRPSLDAPGQIRFNVNTFELITPNLGLSFLLFFQKSMVWKIKKNRFHPFNLIFKYHLNDKTPFWLAAAVSFSANPLVNFEYITFKYPKLKFFNKSMVWKIKKNRFHPFQLIFKHRLNDKTPFWLAAAVSFSANPLVNFEYITIKCPKLKFF